MLGKQVLGDSYTQNEQEPIEQQECSGVSSQDQQDGNESLDVWQQLIKEREQFTNLLEENFKSFKSLKSEQRDLETEKQILRIQQAKLGSELPSLINITALDESDMNSLN